MNTKELKAEKRKARKLSLEQTVREVSAKDKFWCNRNSQFIHVIVCINRQDKARKGCVSCAQGSIVRGTFSQRQAGLNGASIQPERMEIEIGSKRKAIQL